MIGVSISASKVNSVFSSVRNPRMATSTSEVLPELKAAPGFEFDNWEGFRDCLQRRAQPVPARAAFVGLERFWRWGLSPADDGQRQTLLPRLARLYQSRAKFRPRHASLLEWLKEETAGESCNDEVLVAASAIAGVLPGLADVCQPQPWLQALDHLHRLVAVAGGSSDLIHVQLANEIRWQLSVALPELRSTAGLVEAACDAWAKGLDELLDADGAIPAEYMPRLLLLLATWTRVHRLADLSGYELDQDVQCQWEWFVRFGMRLLLRDGRMLLADPAIPDHSGLFQAAVATSTDKEDRKIARLVLPGKKQVRTASQMLAEQGTFSEWAGTGVMQQDWSPLSPRVAVAVHPHAMRIAVSRGIPLFEIEGLPEVSVNGQTLSPNGEWEVLASHFDDDLDYLELEVDLTGGVRLQRQVGLIHGDEAMLVADAVFCPQPERLDYRLQLTLAEDVQAIPESDNTEIYLQQRRIRGLILPLALPEWKQADSDGSCRADGRIVTLDQSALGKTLYAPLFVMLRPKASVRPRTWRPLTVAESLDIVDEDRARAWRVQVGKRQWVLYKSFEGYENRTFLGQNQICDWCIGRLESDGNVEELLSLEP
jgi:hypothetical protein